MKTLTKLIIKSAIAGGTLIGLGLLSAPAQAISLWNWSFTGDVNQSASGTFQTADVTPTAGVTYSITGITGTYNRDSVAYTITGLSGFANGTNTFQWNGTSSSPLLSNTGGISFNTTSEPVNFYYNSGGYGAVDAKFTNFSGRDDYIVSSTLSPATPVPWETDALPVVGSTILFGLGVWAKRKSAKPIQKIDF
ncbi:hypothetical protein [Dolichospermum compactum]|uniref:Uncharacterized protein n=1 Tax=Dolichospermum compactum NIES-806 TaxID=1973481 RepID=A0A1Z4V2L5_9CYAN|nr:hypothetical protein [Dolichospermum compactum]BAZ85683.1 hypothetical protein NIES806_18870 [Dolichospermum compactum NIES-806]